MKHAILDAWLATLHFLGLHTRAEMAAKTRQAESYAREAAVAFAQKREAERLLVLLSEPLKDWDLADFPDWAERPLTGQDRGITTADQRHLSNVVKAYRLTAPAVAPLRMGRVVDDKARRRGWGDEAIRDAFRPPAKRRNLP